CPRGQTCEDGQCFCRPRSCPGCCLGGPDGICAPGTTSQACGRDGETCAVCRLDQCHVAGTCNPATGTCSNPAVGPNGTPCTDGNPLCLNGRCCGEGHEVVHGGCFQITDLECSGCASACDTCSF